MQATSALDAETGEGVRAWSCEEAWTALLSVRGLREHMVRMLERTTQQHRHGPYFGVGVMAVCCNTSCTGCVRWTGVMPRAEDTFVDAVSQVVSEERLFLRSRSWSEGREKCFVLLMFGS